jgi:transcriptional regulator with XRE-family HTH domain
MAEREDEKKRKAIELARELIRAAASDADSAMTAAVKRLRLTIGDTQQQFAQRLHLSISTVVRYETTRAPRGMALAPLWSIAEQNGLRELEVFFKKAALNELEENIAAQRRNLERQIEIDTKIAGWELRLAQLELALQDNQVKPKDKVSHALKEISELRKDTGTLSEVRHEIVHHADGRSTLIEFAVTKGSPHADTRVASEKERSVKE